MASLVVPHVCFVLRARPGSVTTWSRRSRPTAMSQVPTVVGSCRELKLALLGDVMLGRYVSDQFTAAERRRGAFGDVLPLLEQLDSKASLVAGNLECQVMGLTQNAFVEEWVYSCVNFSRRGCQVLQNTYTAQCSSSASVTPQKGHMNDVDMLQQRHFVLPY